MTHRPTNCLKDKFALNAVKFFRGTYDKITGYKAGVTGEDGYLLRCIFLETVAGIPGMAAGMFRHMKSLRTLKQDSGWIHHLLEEAENERMHLLTFLHLY